MNWYLPRVAEPEASGAPALPDSPVNPRAKTILLVEDDEMVRQFTRELLKDSGYQVLCAANGLDGFRLFSERTNPIHLLLTDLVMPHMSGPELARRLRRIAPELKVLYMTGYADNDIFARNGLPLEEPRVQKPFTPETLLNAIGDLLHDGQKHQN